MKTEKDGTVHGTAVHHIDERGRERTITIRGDMRGHSEPSETRGINTHTLVAPIKRRIAQIDEQLSATTNRLDPKTGQAALVYPEGNDARRRLLIERAHLVNHELPYAEHRGAQIEAQRAARPDPLVEEKARRDALAQRAQEIADEQEAEEMASRIAAQRKHGLGIG